MGRAPCCDKANVKRGPWSPEEDTILKNFVEKNGTGGNWIALPRKAGLKRCGKSCRLRWLNYLRPDIKHGDFSEEEDDIICTLYTSIGSRWSIIAAQLPGRTDNDIKNYWNTRLKKKLLGKCSKDNDNQQIRRLLAKEAAKGAGIRGLYNGDHNISSETAAISASNTQSSSESLTEPATAANAMNSPYNALETGKVPGSNSSESKVAGFNATHSPNTHYYEQGFSQFMSQADQYSSLTHMLLRLENNESDCSTDNIQSLGIDTIPSEVPFYASTAMNVKAEAMERPSSDPQLNQACNSVPALWETCTSNSTSGGNNYQFSTLINDDTGNFSYGLSADMDEFIVYRNYAGNGSISQVKEEPDYSTAAAYWASQLAEPAKSSGLTTTSPNYSYILPSSEGGMGSGTTPQGLFQEGIIY